MADRFAQILYDLGQEIGVELHPDQNRICELNYDEQLHMQLQYDEVKEELLMAAFVCDVPPGKYREKLLRATLICNHQDQGKSTFAYSERNNKLTLFTYVPSPDLGPTKLFSLLERFIEKALEWKNAVENGKPLPLQEKPKQEGGSMFGMQP